MGSFWRKLGHKLKVNPRPPSEPHSNTWVLHDYGFEILDPLGRTEYLPWDAIQEIVAFRANRVRAHEVYLEFRHGDEFTLLEESNDQFHAVRVAAQSRFGFGSEWFGSLAHPPFEQVSVDLWRRSSPMKLKKAL